MKIFKFNNDLSFLNTQHHLLIFSVIKIFNILEDQVWFIAFFDKYSNKILSGQVLRFLRQFYWGTLKQPLLENDSNDFTMVD